MVTIPISVSETGFAKLEAWAAEAGLTPEEYLRLRVEQLLDHPDEEFTHVADYVLKKNAELYRRLA